MKTPSLLALTGPEIASPSLSGIYGTGSIRANGFVIADPAYFLSPDDYRELLTERYAQFSGQDHSEWHPLRFQGQTVYFIDCSDGVGPLGLPVDSGWLVAAPVSFVQVDKVAA